MQYYRYAKSEIIATDKAKEAADLARERNDFRIERIERDKLERAQKHADRAALQKQEAEKKAQEPQIAISPASNTDAASAEDSEATQKDAKQAAIAAAIARAKAAKVAAVTSGEAPKNVADADETVKKEITEIDARRQAVGINAASEKSDLGAAANLDKQAKIAAAIAKAKAAKAAAEAAKENSFP